MTVFFLNTFLLHLSDWPSESTCCNGSVKEPKPPKEKKVKPVKPKKGADKETDKDKADKEAKGVAAGKELIKGGNGGGKSTPFQVRIDSDDLSFVQNYV